MHPEPIISLEVATGQRLRIPRKYTQGVKWLMDQHQDVFALAIPGPEGGIRIAPSFKSLQKLEGLAQQNSDEIGLATASLLRYRDNVIKVKFEYEPIRFTLVLPKYFRDLNLLPSRTVNESQKAALRTSGSVLEIWKPVDLTAHLQKVGANLDEFVEKMKEE